MSKFQLWNLNAILLVNNWYSLIHWLTYWPLSPGSIEVNRELTIDVVVDFSSIMQQPELLPAHHPARFSICQFMAERHVQVKTTHRCQRPPPCYRRAAIIIFIFKKVMFTWWSGDDCPACLPISPEKSCHMFPPVSDTLRSESTNTVWLEPKSHTHRP